MAATGLSYVPGMVEIIGNAGRHSSQPFMKGKGSTASNVECAVDSNRTTRHLDAIAVAVRALFSRTIWSAKYLTTTGSGCKPIVRQRRTNLESPFLCLS